MFKALIQKQVSKLTKQDILDFSIQNGITLTSSELDFLFHEIKTNYEVWLYQDTKDSLLKIKDKVEYTTYLKLQELIPYYKAKYKNYL